MYKDNQDRIDAYLRGEMTSDERAEFEKDKNTDAALRQEYLETKAISDAIADRREKLTQMRRWDAEEKLRIKIGRRKKLIRLWTIGVSAAACVAIGFFALKPAYYMTSSNDSYIMPDFSQEAYYRSGDSNLECLDSLIIDKKYDKALTFADSLIYENKLELAQYEPLDSLSEKESYQKLQTEECLYDLEWRMANILLVLDKEAEALILLKELASKENVYSSQADSLLNTINQKK